MSNSGVGDNDKGFAAAFFFRVWFWLIGGSTEKNFEGQSDASTGRGRGSHRLQGKNWAK